jgi:glucosamine 6-phosphate synthetase-like amidotransferase/phosphosugar isomerase protein
MCGIIGMVGQVREGDWQPTHNLLSEMFLKAISRGRDATGYSAIKSPLDAPRRHRAVTAKAPVPADEFIDANPFWRQLRRQRCSAVLGHVRAATSGTPADNANNHPHEGRLTTGRFALVHNGWYTNTTDVVDRHALKLRTECDSECAARLIETTGSVAAGLYRCLTDLKGAQALAVLDYRTGTIWLARDDNRPLWIARLKDGRRTLIASTAEILCRGVEASLGSATDWLESIHPLAPYFVHGLTPSGRLIAPYTTPARPASRGGQ